MNTQLAKHLKGFDRKPGAKEDAISRLEQVFARCLPDELKEILRASDGIGGVIGDHELFIWSVEEIIAYNQANDVQTTCPAFLFFGSTGGGDTYTLDYRTPTPSVVLVPDIGFDYDSAAFLGATFMEFLDRLHDPRPLYD